MMSCGTFKVSTLSYDPIYTTANGETIDVNVVDNEWELNRLLRDDFNFRYDYAQYAKSQPISFDWNNRILRNNRFNRYNFNNRYSWSNGFNMNSYWNRDLMWDDWLWGNYGMGWSYSWNNRSWSSNQWGWNGYYGYGNPYGWNNYYGWGNGYGWNNNGWNNGYRRGSNVAYNIGRRGSTMSVRDRIGQGAMIQSTKVKKRRTINTNVTPIRNNTRVREVRSSEVRVIKPRRATTVITPVRNNRNTTPIRNYNNRPTNNSRSVRTTSPPPRRSTTVIGKRGGNSIKR
tara:strand:- start:517 stop:1374 length:858 start_codon:yes stop_codon:yes gene_type:complete